MPPTAISNADKPIADQVRRIQSSMYWFSYFAIIDASKVKKLWLFLSVFARRFGRNKTDSTQKNVGEKINEISGNTCLFLFMAAYVKQVLPS